MVVQALADASCEAGGAKPPPRVRLNILTVHTSSQCICMKSAAKARLVQRFTKHGLVHDRSGTTPLTLVAKGTSAAKSGFAVDMFKFETKFILDSNLQASCPSKKGLLLLFWARPIAFVCGCTNTPCGTSFRHQQAQHA